MQRWFATYDGGKWSHFGEAFEKLDGSDALRLTKEDMVSTFTKHLDGVVIYRVWRELRRLSRLPGTYLPALRCWSSASGRPIKVMLPCAAWLLWPTLTVHQLLCLGCCSWSCGHRAP